MRIIIFQLSLILSCCLTYGQKDSVVIKLTVRDTATYQLIVESIIAVKNVSQENNGSAFYSTDNKGRCVFKIPKNQNIELCIKKKGYQDYKKNIFESKNDTLSLVANIKLEDKVFSYWMRPIHFEYNKFENRSDSALQSLESFIPVEMPGLKIVILGFSYYDEFYKQDTALAFKRAQFVYNELVRLGFDSECLDIETPPFYPFIIGNEYSIYSQNNFKTKDILTMEYILKLSPDYQKLAHLYNQRVEFIFKE
jgi:hypothetical protein